VGLEAWLEDLPMMDLYGTVLNRETYSDLAIAMSLRPSYRSPSALLRCALAKLGEKRENR
jgi:hypothetical protein